MNYFKDLIEQSSFRTKQASLSVLRVSDKELRMHLDDLLSDSAGKDNAFLADPLFEQIFSWKKSDSEMVDLSGDLLNDDLVLALDNKKNGEYRFGMDFFPYEHQLKSWKALLSDTPKSAVITSGTGSGKTECFMVPILNDLVQEYQKKKKPLIGVRALFLYPLNALINSQQERLNAWTQHFGGDMRFCLYNGKTEEKKSKVRKDQKIKPNEILSRELLREQPAPILVTNGTMLEYMLIRQIDAPIMDISRKEKSLRWIVLDEAHSYIGSQAAELSLLLRRVLLAFGVEAKDVRFIATSATMAGKGSEEKLQRYLADLAGIGLEQVVVIGGERSIPPLPNIKSMTRPFSDIKCIDPEKEISSKRFEALSASPVAKDLRAFLTESSKPLLLKELVQLTKHYNLSSDEVLEWLDLMTGTYPNEGEAFLRLRGHFFQRGIQGFWSCIDPNCSCKKEKKSFLKDKWVFGYVYPYHRVKCDCGAPVYELSFCQECNEPHLLAADHNGVLVQRNDLLVDEFSLQAEISDQEEDDGEVEQPENIHPPEALVLSPQTTNSTVYGTLTVDLKTSVTGTPTDSSIEIRFAYQNGVECSQCGFEGRKNSPFRKAILGAPFYVANSVPTLLEFCPDPDVNKKTQLGPNSLPGRGRKLITFTDSRQGTARMAVKMQQEAERSRLRGLVFEILKRNQNEDDGEIMRSDLSIEDRQFEIDELRSTSKRFRNKGLIKRAVSYEEEAHKMEKGLLGVFNPVSITWQEMVDNISSSGDVKHILKYNHYANPEVFGGNKGGRSVSEMLLVREFLRRPKYQNSLETLGLVKISYEGLSEIKNTPSQWKKNGFSESDWRDFIKISLDFYVRENYFFNLMDDWKKWIGSRVPVKKLLSPSSKSENDKWLKKWPQYKDGQRDPHRLVKILVKGAGFDLSVRANVDQINEWLFEAWKALTVPANSILSKRDNGFCLDREKILFSFAENCFVCPVHNKLLDTTFRGITPYLPSYKYDKKDFQCEKVEIPYIWGFGDKQADSGNASIKAVRSDVKKDEKVKILRGRNLWTDISDRTVEGGFYYRTAEHSAQQSSDRLVNYEKLFKEGEINVLNCSTTMEMGVDIGGISAVAMNNAPPNPANYLQRSGRAGRGNQARAISYTFCKSNPHDSNLFSHPDWPFTASILAPHVSLDSPRIVQRHINSLLLSRFLRDAVGDTSKERTRLNLSWFFEGEELTLCGRYKIWMRENRVDLEMPVSCLTKGTVLSAYSYNKLSAQAESLINTLEVDWVEEFKKLNQQLDKAIKDGPYKSRISHEIKRHRQEYLLKYLAAKAFLPGYGFPTDVVAFNNTNREDYVRLQNKKRREEREDDISRLKDFPSRNLSIAIREYAPGSEIVLDGRVFQSAGISLNWQQIGSFSAKESQKMSVAWRCDGCGQTGVIENVTVNEIDSQCNNCNKKIEEKNKRPFLEPTGFVTEFYAEPTNDVTYQKFIPVERPWVSLESERINLPNPMCGFMKKSHDGQVFYHSSGEHGYGYSVCLSCGRADSMLSAEEYPDKLRPNKQHRPLIGHPEDKDGGSQNHFCEAVGVQPNLHLGYSRPTDVFELYIKSPNCNEFITGNEEGRVIAFTLAVALRGALAEALGVSTSEMGYAVKPARLPDSNESVSVIQVFDQTSGGSGFSTAAPSVVSKILRAAIKKLDCPECDTACSKCLLSADTRFDVDKLNRKAALSWLGDDFDKQLDLPIEMRFFENENNYCFYNLKESLRHQVNQGVETLIFWLSSDLNNWNLGEVQFHNCLCEYLLIDRLKIEIVLPKKDFSEEIKEQLLKLHHLGVFFVYSNFQLSRGVMVSQCLLSTGKVVSFAASSDELIEPNERWFDSNYVEMIVSSGSVKRIHSQPVDMDGWERKSKVNATVISIGNELNGTLDGFGKRFWSFLRDSSSILDRCVKSDQIVSIHYTDRYLQSPWYMFLMLEILKGICINKGVKVTIDSHFKEKNIGRKLDHDWDDLSIHKKIFEAWGCHLDFKLVLNNAERIFDMPHSRKMVLEWQSGEKSILIFDQGVGYWKPCFSKIDKSLYWFDFNCQIEDQMKTLIESYRKVEVKNLAEWKTSVTVLN